MQNLPTQISFRHMDRSEALEQKIHERVDGLKIFSNRVMRCEVVVEKENHDQRDVFHVSLHIMVPGHKIVVSRETHMSDRHEDAFAAVRDAFDAARRRLADHMRRTNLRVKLNAAPYAVAPPH